MAVRVRFAPSPTGPLHIGGIRTALYNYLFARHHGGQFLLRIEDTDQKRYVANAEEYLLEALTWCGLTPDEGPVQGGPDGPYRQSERSAIYAVYAQQLLDSGHAYRAFDTEEELDQWRVREEAATGQPPKYDLHSRMTLRNSLSLPPEETARLLASGADHVLRLRVPENETISFVDLIRGQVSFRSEEVDDKVLLKADGLPTYHLANVVDDHLMHITHVIRGEEWLSSGPLHILLYRYLGWENERPAFAHLPLILNPNGQGKLSKRTADKLGIPVFPLNWLDDASGQTWMGFRENGFEPQALLNFLALLGWNPGTEQELFSMDEMVQAFDLDRVHKAGARFDFDKARWFNQEYLKRMDNGVLASRLGQLLVERGVLHDANALPAIAGMLKERVHLLQEMPEAGHYFFEEPRSLDEAALRKKYKVEGRPVFDQLLGELQDCSPFEAEALEAKVKAYAAQTGQGLGVLMPILRLALAGTLQGPPVFDMMAVLGKEKVVQRLQQNLDRFDALLAG
ncbi:MAG: glutamate--tRNA ligase [Bacteroidetes bacterium]|nr:glutamate--tRNA ligase [Bacteroidota bacterium]